MSTADALHPPPDLPAVESAIRSAVRRLESLQGADGSWRGDYGGPLFLLPLYVAAHFVARREIPAEQRHEMTRYLLGTQLPDGSVGLHVDAEQGTLFTSSLTYVALRMLGASADQPQLVRLREWIRRQGTPLGSAPWGKWVLALLNLYDYRGLTPVLPELYLLPTWVPIHPGRFWCHTRQVYLPTAYLYGAKAAVADCELLRELRGELYDRPYETIPFARYRHWTAACDQIVPERWPSRLAGRVMTLLERCHLPGLRRRALDELLAHIEYEDRTTHDIRIGPVNAALNTIVHVLRGASAEVLERSFASLGRYLQASPDGLKMNGYLSTSLWDTAFATQALLTTGEAASPDVLQRAGTYIRQTQIREELVDRERFFRDPVRGGWPFCDLEHGWPITDCTAEGLKATLQLRDTLGLPAAPDDIAAAVEFLLNYQNRDGGWATYERQRGGAWLEWFNPSQVFANIMVDYSYVECTSASLQALVAAKASVAPTLHAQIDRAIARGRRFLLDRQRADGSWEGSWGICFTYGTWFGVRGLLAAGLTPLDAPIVAAAQFLQRTQHADGGWGEHYRSCIERRYVPRDESSVVNTAWALLALLDAGMVLQPQVERAVQMLLARQLPDGDWPREALTGVFNRTTCINYELYRRYFPLWALASFLRIRRSIPSYK